MLSDMGYTHIFIGNPSNLAYFLFQEKVIYLPGFVTHSRLRLRIGVPVTVPLSLFLAIKNFAIIMELVFEIVLALLIYKIITGSCQVIWKALLKTLRDNYIKK